MKEKILKRFAWFLFALGILILLLLGFTDPARAQGNAFPPDNGPYETGQYILLPQNAVPLITSASVSPTTQTGSNSYYYWIVTHDITNARFSIPAGPFFTSIGPPALSATASIGVQWTPYTLPLTYGQASSNATPFTATNVLYDVLETATPTQPSGACNCAVKIGSGSPTATDTGSYLGYTVNVPAWPANYPVPGNVAGFGPKGSLIDGGVVIPVAGIAGIFTVATLPAAPAVNTLAIVTDAIGGMAATGTGTNCTTGGGTTTAFCRWTGATWLVVGGPIPPGFASAINGLVYVDTLGRTQSAGLTLSTLDGAYWFGSSRKLSVGANAASATFPFVSSCTNCATGSRVGVLDSAGLNLSAGATDYANLYTTVNNDTAGAISAEFDFAIANGGTFAPPPGFNLPLSVRFLPNGQIVLVGQTSGNAQIGVAAVAGTPNPVNLPTTTGAAGAVMTTDGGNPQQLSWKPASLQNPVQNYSVTTESSDTALTSGTPAVVITKAVTMPASGCPCRASTVWMQYLTSTGSGQTADLFVSDGTVKFAEGEREVDIIGNAASQTGSGYSPVTYANSAVVTFTLTIQVNGTGTIARAASFQSLGMRNSRLEIAVFPSN